MTILPVRTIGDPVLRTACRPVGTPDAELAKLIEDMLETMFDVGGVGLAAPQVGVELRLFVWVLEGPGGPVGHVLNPVLEVSEDPQEGGEGCLSVPGLSAETPRARWARVTGTDVHGRPVDVAGEGLLARCLQHETDHLDGTLYVDRVRGEDRRRIMRQLRDRDFGNRSQAVTGQRSGRVSSAFGAGASVAPGASFGGGR